ncbi:hypothetical protein VMCG_08067 [Cytospora schulzeri]|uniref:Uncharacterized protein n=1 Tax=Cytospora schulzeri TaxID=448051 RepID=A0A423VRE2_9PEZI|nr:hypothetical protein VMCG_08067 [Valsa malicola]
MEPPEEAEIVGDGAPMDLDAAEADLDTEMTMGEPNSINVPFDITDIQVALNETPSLFDRFPEAFSKYEDDDTDRAFYNSSGVPGNMVSIYGQLPKMPIIDPDQQPYSYMVENPGQVPQALSKPEPKLKPSMRKFRRPLPPIPKTIDGIPMFNIAGEEALERQFRRIPNPVNYLIVVRGFRLLMAIRNMTVGNKPLLDAKTLGIFIGRLFSGHPETLAIFNKYFLPKNLEIVPVMAIGEIQSHYNDLHRRFWKDKSLQTPEIVKLLSMLGHFGREIFSGQRWQREPVGSLRMVMSYTGIQGTLIEVPHGGMAVPYGPELPRCVDLSPDFMRRFGRRWPFNVDPASVDVCGLTHERRSKGSAALRPRQLYREPSRL